jgi:hypothetical protein
MNFGKASCITERQLEALDGSVHEWRRSVVVDSFAVHLLNQVEFERLEVGRKLVVANVVDAERVRLTPTVSWSSPGAERHTVPES